MEINTNVWVVRMKRKYITVEVLYDTEETWQEAKEEIEEIMDMMNNLKRKARITNIEQGIDTNEE
jgi:hypothetical protein